MPPSCRNSRHLGEQLSLKVHWFSFEHILLKEFLWCHRYILDIALPLGGIRNYSDSRCCLITAAHSIVFQCPKSWILVQNVHCIFLWMSYPFQNKKKKLYWELSILLSQLFFLNAKTLFASLACLNARKLEAKEEKTTLPICFFTWFDDWLIVTRGVNFTIVRQV